MAEIWRASDRRGREVSLGSQGRDHILSRHGEMADRLDELQAAIQHPDVVTRDVKYRHRENHYSRTEAEPGWIKIVVQYRPVPPQGTWEGEVITAYPVNQPDPEEELFAP